MTHSRSVRFVTALLALVFSLAMAGPETHACPIHSGVPAAPGAPSSHHHNSRQHQQATHCTCPQACCPAGAIVALPSAAAVWTVQIPLVRVVAADQSTSVALPVRKHLRPLAQAPPPTLL